MSQNSKFCGPPAFTAVREPLQPSPRQIFNELTAIRAELAALREALQPPRSIIITGPEVERVLAAMKGGE